MDFSNQAAPSGGGGAAAGGNPSGGSMDFSSQAAPQPTANQLTAPPRPCNESRILQQSIKLYESKDYYGASIQLDKILNGGADSCQADQEKAQFYMGETLFHLKYYAEALTYFSHIADAGQYHLYYKKALPWLAALSEKLPDSSGVLDKVGTYGEQYLDEGELKPVRDQLLYLVGRYDFSQGKTEDAIRLFEEVSDKSDYFIKAKFLEGTSYIRPPSTDFKSAAEQFKQILRKTYGIDPDKKTPDQVRYEELADLGLARSFYSVAQYPQAIKYYDKIPQESPDWLDSVWEESWAMFMENSQSHALGNIQTLNAPYFDTQFYPESLVLKGLIYYENCRFDGSGAALAEFRSKYMPIMKDLKAVLEKYQDPADLYDFTVKILKGTSGLSEAAARAAQSVLNDKELKKNYTFVSELDLEANMINHSPADWKSTQVSGNILADLEVQQSLAKAKAGGLAHDRLQSLVDNIRDLNNQATRIEIETIEAQKGHIPEEIKDFPAAHDESIVDDEHNLWPFDGEYWKDELGYYRYHIENRCPRESH